MTIAEIIEGLPGLTVEERQLLIRRAIELDDPPLSEADEQLVHERLTRHHSNPDSSISLEDLKARLRRS